MESVADFTDWFKDHFEQEEINSIASNGIMNGHSKYIYTQDLLDTYDRFTDAIVILVEDARQESSYEDSIVQYLQDAKNHGKPFDTREYVLTAMVIVASEYLAATLANN